MTTIATDISQERQDALAGACTPSGTIACSINELFGPAPVDPAEATSSTSFSSPGAHVSNAPAGRSRWNPVAATRSNWSLALTRSNG